MLNRKCYWKNNNKRIILNNRKKQAGSCRATAVRQAFWWQMCVHLYILTTLVRMCMLSVCCPHKPQTVTHVFPYVLMHRMAVRVDLPSACTIHLQRRMNSSLWCNKATIHVSPLSILFKVGPRGHELLSSNDLIPREMIQMLWFILQSVL